jgi:subtilisin family serine protease
MRFFCIFTLLISFATETMALNESRVEMRVPEAFAAYGVTGKGVTVAVLDRGITWDHPDFIDANGKTRIRAMLDQSGQNYCAANNPQPVEYTEAQINQALAEGGSLGMRDAVGHGTATAGTAAGNGRGLPDGRYQGIAPEADLIIVKMTSESTPAHGDQPAQTGFNGCIDQAIDWAAAKMDELDQPAVLIINSGVQWGPMDGSGAVSRKLAEVFPQDKPGRIVVLPSGDEGSLPNHSGTGFDNTTSTIGFSKASTAFGVMSAWYSGDAPADVTVRFDDGLVIGPIGPGQQQTQDGITVVQYLPGQEFYPWTSDSGDRAVWVGGTGHATTGSFEITARGDGAGYVDLYGDVLGPNLTPIFSMTDHLVPGRLNDYATTPTAIISGDHIIRTSYVDLNGVQRNINDEGVTGGLWLKSSAGPSRDGRDYGVDSTAPGQNMFAPVGPDSWWATSPGNQPQGSEGLYIRFGGTSGSAPLMVGVVALMLQVNPQMTTRQAREILRATARSDEFTGDVPNVDWGGGKTDALEAVTRALAYSFSGSWYNSSQSGHGWFVEVLQGSDGSRRLVVYWYVYQDGAPAWILATGPLDGTVATMDAFISSGGEFPPDFDGADVVPWGTMTMEFEAGGTAIISWDTSYTGFTSGSLSVVQLTNVSATPEACSSGSYYNAAQSGHGFVIQIVDLGGVSYVTVTWYVYLDGKQVWLLGLAPLNGDRAEIPLDAWTGAQFPPDFNTNETVSTPWGTMTLVFEDPDNIQASWTTDQPGYSDGSLAVTRISQLGGHECVE